jgi:transaldolase
MQTTKPNTKILVDGGDPEETERLKILIGFVDGQTTNPSLIPKNPVIQAQVVSGHKLSLEQQTQEYKKSVQTISPLVEEAGYRSKYSPISRQAPSKCLRRARICSPGFLMLTLNTHAYMKVCVLQGDR